MTSPVLMGLCVSSFSITSRLRAGSFLAGFFHVYSSYRTTFTKRKLHSDFKEAQPIAKAALSTITPQSQNQPHSL